MNTQKTGLAPKHQRLILVVVALLVYAYFRGV